MKHVATDGAGDEVADPIEPGTHPSDPISDAARLAAVSALGLGSHRSVEAERVLHELASVAQRRLRAPLVLISVLTDSEQWVLAAAGPAAAHIAGERPAVRDSLCQHVVRTGAELLISNTADEVLVRANPTVTDRGVQAYAGVPLMIGTGLTVGALCAFDFTRRIWSDDELLDLRSLAAAAAAQLELLGAQKLIRSLKANPPVAVHAVGSDAPHVMVTQQIGDGTWRWDISTDALHLSAEQRGLPGVPGDAPASASMDMTALHPDDVDVVRSARDMHLAEQKPFDVTVRVRLPTGTWRWFRMRGQSVTDTTGADRCLAGSLDDVTEQLRTAAALKLSEVQLAQLIGSAMDAVICATPDGDIILCNRAAEQAFAISAFDAARRSLDQLLPLWRSHAPGDARMAVDASHAVIAMTGIRGDGVSFPAEVTISHTTAPMPAGTLATLTVIVRDVTQRTQLETELRHAQKMEAVGRLAAGIAHDFNNVLMAIRASAEFAMDVLQRTDPTSAAITDVQAVVHGADRAAALSSQLLSFSRKQVLASRAVNVDATLVGLVPMLQRLLGGTVTIRTYLASESMHVRVDPGQLEQVLVNLAINARDAMVHGGDVTISTGPVARDDVPATAGTPLAPHGHFVLVRVSDTGVGMDAETQARAFEPFFTTKAENRGTGLGLASAHGFIQQSGGVIWVDSRLGRGTTVSFVLPALEHEHANNVAMSDDAASATRLNHDLQG